MSAAESRAARLPSSAMFGALAGVVLFFLVFDPRLLDPGYWIWLLEGDPATQYLGWRFFRAEPWLWPPGMIRSYGLEVGSAIDGDLAFYPDDDLMLGEDEQGPFYAHKDGRRYPR